VPLLFLLLADVLVGSFGAAALLDGGPASLAVIAVAAAAVFTLIVLHDRVPLTTDRGLVASAVRQRSTRTAFMPLCNPAADGRPRPRAPSLPAWAA
jgi:hypothetical protein